jgi:hypothetical protein
MYGAPGYQQPGFQQPGFQQPGYGQPMFQPMQPMYQQPVQQGPTIIHIDNDNNDGSPCQYCGTNTGQIPRRKVGCVAILWGLCLLWTTGFLCCLPCCMDGCKDT